MELVINNLSKKYGNSVHALNNVSLTINKGLFSFLA
jgi:ABC-2 type transport system ATP-binding protein